MLVSSSSAVLRRQLFLIRCLGGGVGQSHKKIRRVNCSSMVAMEADAEHVIRKITPLLDPIRHKGQAGVNWFSLCMFCMRFFQALAA